MTIQAAARSLTDRLRINPWFTAVGIGEIEGNPCLYLYVSSVKNADLSFLKDGWNGYRVEVRRMGPPRIRTKPVAS